MRPSSGPPYRVATPRLVIRCWHPSDAPLLKRAVDESLAYLSAWLPWARSVDPVETYVTRLRAFRAAFDVGQEYVYGVFDPEESRVLGGTGFHPRVGPRALEIGYWIHVNHAGQGLATEVAGALSRVGFEVEQLARLDIHCDPANVASARVAVKLGYRHEATLRQRIVGVDGSLRDSMIFTLLADEYQSAACRNLPVRAWNALGQQTL